MLVQVRIQLLSHLAVISLFFWGLVCGFQERAGFQELYSWEPVGSWNCYDSQEKRFRE
jgi:hypothetical protein